MAATLPLAGAFRELLQTNPSTGKQFWVVDWKEAFKRTADELYRALTNNLVSASPIASLGSDQAYWTNSCQCYPEGQVGDASGTPDCSQLSGNAVLYSTGNTGPLVSTVFPVFSVGHTKRAKLNLVTGDDVLIAVDTTKVAP